MKKKVQAVIYTIEKEKKKYLILHRKLHWVGWEHLKETMEQGESYEDTIRRGIEEEIGVKEITIEKEKGVSIPMNKKEEIVYAYLIKIDAKSKIDVSKEKEHDGYKWVEKEDALNLLTYGNAKILLNELTETKDSK